MNTDDVIRNIESDRYVILNLEKGICDDKARAILEEMKNQNEIGIELLKVFSEKLDSLEERLTKLEKLLQNTKGENNEQ